ncbi:MAG: hypothetical protein NTY14_02445 [Candidatus Omnitrophica bacterium]|nr:hypothetical protein [Candidatus Omnitrophota bacterium]
MARKSLKSRIMILMLTASLVFAYKPLSAEITLPLPTAGLGYSGITFSSASADLWQYLRIGLNYLESPKPLQPPEAVPPTYIHPDSQGFGAYGFSPGAYQDVQRLYPFFQKYSWQEIMNSPKLYDLANQAFADWLLKNLKDYIPEGASKEEIFDVLHQAWNLGLSGFKNGRQVVASRAKRAQEFKGRL